jgi:hypothetical protein
MITGPDERIKNDTISATKQKNLFCNILNKDTLRVLKQWHLFCTVKQRIIQEMFLMQSEMLKN